MATQHAGMSLQELLALPVSVDLETARRAFPLGRTKAQELARQGKFPVPVLRLGNAYRVRRSDLLEWFGVTDHQDGPGAA